MIEFDKEKKETMTRKLGLVIALMLAMFVGTTAFAKTPAPGQNTNSSMSSDNGGMKKSSRRRRHRRARRRHHRRSSKSGMSKTTGNGNMK
jgi:hypothetical protein